MWQSFFGAAALAAGHAIVERMFGAPQYRCLEWSGSMTLPVPPAEARDFVYRHYCQHTNATLARGTRAEQVFDRGDASILRLPATRKVTWHEVPIRIEVRYGVAIGGLEAGFVYRTPPETVFQKPAAEFFVAQAEREFNELFESIKEQHTRSSSRSGSSERESASERSRLDASLAVLGLKRGASLDEVITAYRDACKKYHPDTLSGKQVPQYLIDLAVARFKEIQVAYELLKAELRRG